MTRSGLCFALLAALACSLPALADDIEWQHRTTQGKVTLMANPLGVASRTSFYEARGFAVSTISPYALACGFSFGMLNEGSEVITVPLQSWRAIGADGKEIPFRLTEDWEKDWTKADIPEPARIAFRWAQFQSDNRFEPGDWIMGMATLAAVPRPPFRIVARFHDNQGKHDLQLDNLRCADD